MSSPLTPEVLEELRAEFQLSSHRTTADVAAALGVTKNAVIGAMNRAGIKSAKRIGERPRVSSLPQGRVRAVVESCVTWVSAAALLGVHWNSLRTHCIANGIRLKEREIRPQRERREGYKDWLLHNDRRLADNPRRPRLGRPGPGRAVKASDISDMRRLADEAIAAGRITKCPPAWAAGSIRMSWERIL